ncbi:MAG: DUF4491 family protein [Oscillospiraceae bacterium]|jgi:hypothetical protein|nr:DUF4491 family protein [Oscillospiraceae bacterium]
MNFQGIFAGMATFALIGILHPVVVWAERVFSKRCWWVFLVAGLWATLASVFMENVLFSCILAVLGFSLFWCIKEVIEQEERAKRSAQTKTASSQEQTALL